LVSAAHFHLIPVGGPDRPIPEKKPVERAAPPTSKGSSGNVLDGATAGVNDLYSRLGSAISERGQMLDGLEDTVSSLQQGSSNMLAQVCVSPLWKSSPSHHMDAGEETGFGTVGEELVQSWIAIICTYVPTSVRVQRYDVTLQLLGVEKKSA
jgi:hypothetical protein